MKLAISMAVSSPRKNINSGYIIVYFLILPIIFNSALIPSLYFGTLRVPLYLVSVLLTLLLSLNKKVYAFVKLPLLLLLLFVFPLLLNALFTNYYNFAANVRQILVYGSLFSCAYVGFFAYNYSQIKQINIVNVLLWIHAILFVYGVYTFYCQLYDLPAFLNFLRPEPVLSADTDTRGTLEQFSGWAGNARAYSVWYEPSFASIIVACTAPLLYFSKDITVRVAYIISVTIFAYLTYSRSVWLVLVVFFLFHFLLVNRRLPRSLLFVSISVLFVVVGSIAIQFFYLDISSDISAPIRLFTTVNGLDEARNSLVIGLGTPELINPYFLNDFGSLHIHNSFVSMLHWVGVFGLAIIMVPFIVLIRMTAPLRDNSYQIAYTFIMLTVIAYTIGGNLISLSTFWFAFGLYFAMFKQRRRNAMFEISCSERMMRRKSRGEILC